MLTISWLFISLVLPFTLAPSAWAAASYEESLKLLAEEVTAGAVKGKSRRIAFLDFTDSKGLSTSVGQFLAEEIGTQVLLAGELAVVERTVLHSALKKLHVDQLDQTQMTAMRQAAKTIRADAFVSGVYIESPDSLQVTAKVINPTNNQMIAATRGTFPKTGPLAQLFKKEEPLQPIAKVDAVKESPQRVGMGTHQNEYYELVVHSIDHQSGRATVDLTIENRFPRGFRILCYLQDTVLKDDQGGIWHQAVEDNREGLCTRGLELSPRRKQRAVLTFTAPGKSAASQFTFHFHETSPRRNASFVLDGLKLDPVSPSGPATQSSQ
jgi:TolB-like protein